MKCDVKIITSCKNPEILISTPLLPGHKISKITKKTLKRNDIDYIWLTSSGNNNIPINHLGNIEWYKKNIGKLPPYIFFLDRDIDLGRHALDRLHNSLVKESYRSDVKIGYSYASFKYTGGSTIWPPTPIIDSNINAAGFLSSFDN